MEGAIDLGLAKPNPEVWTFYPLDFVASFVANFVERSGLLQTKQLTFGGGNVLP